MVGFSPTRPSAGVAEPNPGRATAARSPSPEAACRHDPRARPRGAISDAPLQRCPRPLGPAARRRGSAGFDRSREDRERWPWCCRSSCSPPPSSPPLPPWPARPTWRRRGPRPPACAPGWTTSTAGWRCSPRTWRRPTPTGSSCWPTPPGWTAADASPNASWPPPRPSWTSVPAAATSPVPAGSWPAWSAPTTRPTSWPGWRCRGACSRPTWPWSTRWRRPRPGSTTPVRASRPAWSSRHAAPSSSTPSAPRPSNSPPTSSASCAPWTAVSPP